MRTLKFEVDGVRGGSERKIYRSIGESGEERRDARKGLRGRKVHALECRLFGHEFGPRHGKLRPGVEDFAGLK